MTAEKQGADQKDTDTIHAEEKAVYTDSAPRHEEKPAEAISDQAEKPQSRWYITHTDTGHGDGVDDELQKEDGYITFTFIPDAEEER